MAKKSKKSQFPTMLYIFPDETGEYLLTEKDQKELSNLEDGEPVAIYELVKEVKLSKKVTLE